MARARKRTATAAQSPTDAVARRAEALAASRFGLQINGRDFITDDLTIDVARMYWLLLQNSRG